MYLRSAFFISLLTYLLLLLAEVVQPGFVSNYFSAHWLLLLVLVFLTLSVRRDEDLHLRPGVLWGMTLVVALIFAVVTWQLGSSLGGLRILLTLLVAALPIGWIFVLKE